MSPCCGSGGDENEDIEGRELMGGDSFRGENSLFFKFYNEKVRTFQQQAGDVDHCPISGNLYLYRALAHFGDSSKLFQDPATPLVMLGLGIVVTVQVIGPLCILFWCFYKIDFFPNGNIFGIKESLGYKQNTDKHGVSHITQRILGVLFLVLFNANGLYVLRKDQDSTWKVTNLCKIFKRAASVSNYEPPRERWLYIGAVINCCCLVLCSFCMCLLFVLAEDGPKDVLFDAFGMTFLYNLDDVGGDLGFLDDKWDEGQMGDIYGMLADEKDIMEEFDSERKSTFTSDNVYDIGMAIVSILLVIEPLAFLFVEMKPSS